MVGAPLALPEVLPADGDLLVRRWLPSDAEALERAVELSREHLSPWLPWADVVMSPEERRGQIRAWEAQWAQGGDVIYGVFLRGEAAGGGGLHHRLGPGGLEIGYWIAAAHVGRGLATRFAELATDAAFSVPGIDHVEIHHDRANAASGAVPRRLGYRRAGEGPGPQRTDAESGVELRWRVTRTEWLTQRHSADTPRPTGTVARVPVPESGRPKRADQCADADEFR